MANILQSLSKKDAYWREVALKITGNKHLADELVQNMYLKIYSANPEKWNYSYVILTIYNLFKDVKKSNKYNVEIEDDKTKDVTISDNYSYTNREIEILNRIENLTDYEKELIYLNYDLSTGKIAKEYNQCRIKTYRHLIKIRKKILGEDLDGYNNKRLKWRK
ncbi:RNA polymerase sigma factor [Polaribacter sp.]|uniref:RNA polymerase sigma factor n=1 Tax=Polaribacter sp. TaxID=1920175 RepID=UPI003F6B34D3